MARIFDVEREELEALGKELWRPAFAEGVKTGSNIPALRHPLLAVVGVLSLALILYGFALWNMRDPQWGNFLALGFFLVFVSWLMIGYYGTKKRSALRLAVYEGGVIVPKTVQNVPGLERVGGPRAFLRTDVVKATRIEEGDNLAILLTTRVGSTGLVDHNARRPPLTRDELLSLMLGMCNALEKIGVPVTRGGMEAVAPRYDAEEA